MDDLQELVQGNTTFAFALYRQLRERDGNLFFSPYSLSAALGMTQAGARCATETEIASGLHFTLNRESLHPAFRALQQSIGAAQGERVIVRVANALWPHVDYRFLDAFINVLQTCYGASLTQLDYRDPEPARQIINAWVAEKTADQIRDVIPPGLLNPLTRLVLSNAIYFKGAWAEPFEQEMTAPESFWVTPQHDVPVPMMHITTGFGYAETDQAQMLELSYHGKSLSMLILLPKALDGLAQIESTLGALPVQGLQRAEVALSLPKFKLECAFQLNDALRSLGIQEAFDREKADFSGMDPDNRLFISDVIHQAFVDVTEEGTEAAAATIMAAQCLGAPVLPLVFRANHPFLFVIHENSTGSILFMGRVHVPVGSSQR